MFDRSTSVYADNFSFMPLTKTKPDSFFVYALKGHFMHPSYSTPEDRVRIDAENKKEREMKNAVSLNDLLGESPHIDGRRVEVLQLLLLNKYANEAMVEVRYV